MNLDYLDFEQPVAELQQKIDELRNVADGSEVNLTEEIKRLQNKSNLLTKQIFSSLTPWQVVQIARHPRRPHSLDYIDQIFTDFEQLHGDRHFRDDPAIVGGLARLDGYSVMLIAQQKARDTKEKLLRNFGMPKPEGYRKALRLMRLAERYQLPIITFIDTPGAYPGIGAEERNQSEAIARNLLEMSRLRVPVISTVIGEGGSGGALAIGVADHLAMLQYSIYSVISPEGCASILWKKAEMAPQAAETLALTSEAIYSQGLIDEIIPEPAGGAHRDLEATAATVKKRICKQLQRLRSAPPEELVQTRYERLMRYGEYKTVA